MSTGLLILALTAPPQAPLPFGLWLRRMRTRATLRTLDARSLADVGITEAGRQRECAKWPWEA